MRVLFDNDDICFEVEEGDLYYKYILTANKCLKYYINLPTKNRWIMDGKIVIENGEMNEYTPAEFIQYLRDIDYLHEDDEISFAVKCVNNGQVVDKCMNGLYNLMPYFISEQLIETPYIIRRGDTLFSIPSIHDNISYPTALALSKFEGTLKMYGQTYNDLQNRITQIGKCANGQNVITFIIVLLMMIIIFVTK